MSLVRPGGDHAFQGFLWEGSLKRGANEDFWHGSTTGHSTPADPLVNGYAFIRWVKLPTWVREEYEDFSALFEKNFKSFGGLENFTLENGEMGSGFSQNNADFATSIGAKPKQFTIAHNEFSGSPMRSAYAHWVSGIRDPETNVATYPKDYGIEYSDSNHTGEFVYIMTRPDADNVEANILEFAAYFTHVKPTVIPNDFYNYQTGTHELGEFEQPFSARMHVSSTVDEYAMNLLRSRQTNFKHANDFDPEADHLL